MNKQFTAHESGLYVAEDGEVFVPKSRTHPAHYTYGTDNGKGYRVVRYKGKRYLVHRLVAETYIPNPENKPYVDHILPVKNGGTNDVSNLRWTTQEENCNNLQSLKNYSEAKKGKKQSEECVRKRAEAMKGKHNNPKKPVVGTNKETGITVEFESATDAWLVLNINKGDICSCCQGKRKSAGGYEWNYA